MPSDTWRMGLESLIRLYPQPTCPRDDPLAFVYRYHDVWDREVVAYLISFFAFGSVQAMVRFLESLLHALGPRPYETLRGVSLDQWPILTKGLAYRFLTSDAVAAVMDWVWSRVRRWGSLRAYFAERIQQADSLRVFVESYADEGRAFLTHRWPILPVRTVRFLFPRPPGSACKRLALFLRWMTRPAPPDLGLWDFWPRPWVFVPVDVHMAFFARLWGWVSGRGITWRTVEVLGERLRCLNPDDPLRYDYAITHLGMQGPCHRNPAYRRCGRCPLREVCPARNSETSR